MIWASAPQRLPDLDLPALPQLRDDARRRDDPTAAPLTSLRCLTTGTEAVYSMGLRNTDSPNCQYNLAPIQLPCGGLELASNTSLMLLFGFGIPPAGEKVHTSLTKSSNSVFIALR